MKKLSLIAMVLATLLITCCGGPDERNVTISWDTNKEASVNRAGGGYILYYSQTSGFDTSTASSVTLSYESGSSSPTSTTVKLTDGTWYAKVIAFGVVAGSTKYSQASAEATISVHEN